MRLIKVLLLAVSLGLIFYSCNPCNDLDCTASNYYGQFRLVKANDGSDLVFGINKVYDKNTIKFYSLKNTDTTFFEYQPIRFASNNTYDSILQIYFFPQVDTAYMQLSDGDIDTLGISYKTYDTKCCGVITEIKNFRLNNLIDIPGSQGTQEIKK